MKKFIIPLLLLSAVLSCGAAVPDAGTFGTLAGVLNNPDRKLRLSMLLPQCARSAELFYRFEMFIRAELAGAKPDKETAGQLYLLACENPALSGLTLLAADYCAYAGYTPAQMRELLKLAAEAADLTIESPKRFNDALTVFSRHLTELIKDDRFDEAGVLLAKLDRLKSPHREAVQRTAVRFYNLICFRYYDSSPNFRSWKNIPETSWKKRYLNALNTLQVTDHSIPLAKAFDRAYFYSSLPDPCAVEYAGKLLDIPGCTEIFAPVAQNVAFLFSDTRLYKKCSALVKTTPTTDFLLYATQPNSADAANALKAMPADVHEQLQLYLLVKSEKYQDAVRQADRILDKAAKDKGNSLIKLTTHSIIALIEKTRDKKLYRKLFKTAEKWLDNAELANSFGYLATILEIDLPRAEKLIQRALQESPDSAAYLDSMAYLQYKNKKFKSAQQFMRKALRQRLPGMSNAPLYLHAAEIEFALKNNAKAKEYLRRARFCAADNDDEFDYNTAKKLEDALK